MTHLKLGFLALLIFVGSPACLRANDEAKWRGIGLQDGDFLFIESTSSQSAALKEATGSPWTHVGLILRYRAGDPRLKKFETVYNFKTGDWVVAEASSTVTLTPLDNFVSGKRSRAENFTVARHPTFKDRAPTVKEVDDLWKAFFDYYAKPYDIHFKWSDEFIYCSELTYKMFKKIDLESGTFEKLAEFFGNERSKSRALALRKQRDPNNRILSDHQVILSPKSQLNSLKVIFQKYRPGTGPDNLSP